MAIWLFGPSSIPRNAGYAKRLLGFAVRFMAPAKTAVFRKFETVGVVLLILLRVVIAAFALRASHRNHHAVFFFRHFRS